ncbi:hypothetical protein Drorol1_Dr00025161 [Drosera rotundifolia]
MGGSKSSYNHHSLRETDSNHSSISFNENPDIIRESQQCRCANVAIVDGIIALALTLALALALDWRRLVLTRSDNYTLACLDEKDVYSMRVVRGGVLVFGFGMLDGVCGSGLVNAYSRLGQVEEGKKVFGRIGIWNLASGI